MKTAGQVLAALFFYLSGFVSGAAAKAGDFDFYVLALSWSPSYCATAQDARGSAQCDADFGFVVHGLWPQYERGYPQFCGPDARLAETVVQSVLDIVPDADLVRHEWRKHGTCSGLSPKSYFDAARRAFAAIAVPREFGASPDDRTLSAEAVEAAFVAANPGLTRDGIAVACRSGVLQEVRICLTRDLSFRACAEVDADGCKQSGLRLPAIH